MFAALLVACVCGAQRRNRARARSGARFWRALTAPATQRRTEYDSDDEQVADAAAAAASEQKQTGK